MEMLLVTKEEFFEKAKTMSRLSREEEIKCAQEMLSGKEEARKIIIESYISQVSAYISRLPGKYQTLNMIYTCLNALETQVDKFDFLQESESFSHRLGWVLRQSLTKCMASE